MYICDINPKIKPNTQSIYTFGNRCSQSTQGKLTKSSMDPTPMF